MAAVSSLEKTLEGVFKGAPKLPDSGRNALVQWLPWINLVLGVLALWAAYELYHWANIATAYVNYANNLGRIYGYAPVSTSTTRWDLGLWLGLIVLLIEGLLYLAAFPGTRDRKKSGWNLLFYAVLLNAVYGIVILFTDYGGFGSLLSYLITAIVGLYLLFQIRGAYMGQKPAAKKAAKS